uniref:Glucosylceramidase n=1 Tax=Pseudonaja textilis TaxID=8673 RepID=A0A670ZA12_PSETE
MTYKGPFPLFKKKIISILVSQVEFSTPTILPFTTSTSKVSADRSPTPRLLEDHNFFPSLCLSASAGSEYNLLRWPIGCSDFSTRPYSYGDHCVDDFELKCFELAPEDTKIRIPLLHRIMALTKRPLSLVGSPWTSPAWLRVNNRVYGKSKIKGNPGDRYHKAWARYFIRFLDEYAQNNITFWALSSQNEPITALFVSRSDFPCNYFSPQHQRDFIIQDLGPALVAGGYTDIRLMILDDLRCHLPNWADQVVLDDPEPISAFDSEPLSEPSPDSRTGPCSSPTSSLSWGGILNLQLCV